MIAPATKSTAAKSSTEARALVDALRLELIAEAADAGTAFIVSARRHALDGDLARLGENLAALWLAAQVMRKTFREIAGDGEGGGT